MDPNATLAILRQLVEDMRAWTESGEDPDEPGEYYRIASEATEAFNSLDEWISTGGFLPGGWGGGKPARLVLTQADFEQFQERWNRLYGARHRNKAENDQ